MQDIDFDEIDRAVNSITNTDFEANTDVNTGLQTNAAPAPVAAPSPAARRSSGRFMDVVHSSSDMRPSVGPRPSLPFAPSFHREEVAEREEVASRPEPAAAASTAFHWPDPIDVSGSTPNVIEEVEPSVPEPAAEVIEAPTIVPELEDENEDEYTTPLESPFLSDAKVEKRPLGAFSGADAELPLLEDPIPFSTNSTPQSGPQPESQPDPVPAVEEPAHEEHEEIPHELHPELLALEGHGVEVNDTEPLLEATNPPDPEPVTATEDVPTGPTSITQQYKEQPSTASEPSSGSIFDTEAYHQPLTHAVKKHSGILVIVWIIALILVGGGIGAAVYFVVLPMLG